MMITMFQPLILTVSLLAVVIFPSNTITVNGFYIDPAAAATSAATSSVKPQKPLTTPESKDGDSKTDKLLKPWPKPVIECNGDYRDEIFLEKHIGGPMYEKQKDLPLLPVPTIDETIEKLLTTSLPLAKSDEEKESFIDACNDFQSSDDVSTLQKLLISRKDSIKNSSWLQHWWNTIGYLKFRDPIAMFVSYFLELEDDPTIHKATKTTIDDSWGYDIDSCVKRSAAALHNAAKFRNLISSGTYSPDTVGRGDMKTPLCMTMYKYMFHGCRIPQEEQDSYKIYDPTCNTHAVVACHGNFYKIPFVNATTNKPIPINALEEILWKCIDKSIEEEPSDDNNNHNTLELGWLTTMNRDDWTNARNDLIKLGGSPMKEALETLQSSALLLSIDDEECPITFEQCAKEYWVGGTTSGSFNRWFDKSVQLIVTENGKLGVIGEHSMMDGMPVVSLCNYILNTTYGDLIDSSIEAGSNNQKQEDIDSGSTEEHGDSNGNGDEVQDVFKHVWSEMSTDDINHVQALIDKAKSNHNKVVDDHEIHVVNYEGYGSDYIKKVGFSPDAYVQMAIQLASYNLFGEKQVATYEATQVRSFLHGRTETTRSVSEASEKFVKSMDNPLLNDKDKLSLLRGAIDYHKDYIRSAASGKGIDRHLFGLEMILDETNDKNTKTIETPTLFNHPLYKKSKHWSVSTSSVPHALGFGQVVDDGIGCGYEIKKDSIFFTVTSRHDKLYSQKFRFYLQQALQYMKYITM